MLVEEPQVVSAQPALFVALDPVAMDDETVFMRLAHGLFAENIEFDRPVRLVGFRLGNLEMPLSRQSTLDVDE